MGATRRSPRKREVDDTLELHGGRLRVAVFSDTHSNPHPRAAKLVAALEPDAIRHAGDVGDPAVLLRHIGCETGEGWTP